MTSAAERHQQFDDEQFELQLEFEDMTIEQVRDLGDECRRWYAAKRRPRQEALDCSLRIWVALLRSPVLSDDEREDRLIAWCEGLGIPLDVVLDSFTPRERR